MGPKNWRDGKQPTRTKYFGYPGSLDSSMVENRPIKEFIEIPEKFRSARDVCDVIVKVVKTSESKKKKNKAETEYVFCQSQALMKVRDVLAGPHPRGVGWVLVGSTHKRQKF